MMDGKEGLNKISPKSRRVTALLAIFLGVFGIHRFYLEKVPTAYIMLGLGIAGCSVLGVMQSVHSYRIDSGKFLIAGIAIFAAVGVWAIVDFGLTVIGNMKDKDGRQIKKW